MRPVLYLGTHNTNEQNIYLVVRYHVGRDIAQYNVRDMTATGPRDVLTLHRTSKVTLYVT